MPVMPHAIHPGPRWPLHDTAATRRIEQAAANTLPAHTLMQRAGLATARLALALAPHARRVWIAAGPGNNGGDGLEAALHLHAWGLNPVVTWLGTPDSAPADARASWQRAVQAGVAFADQPPADLGPQDLAIDALLGIGATRAPAGRMADWLKHMHAGPAPALAVDVPTGLDADSGWLQAPVTTDSIAASADPASARSQNDLKRSTPEQSEARVLLPLPLGEGRGEGQQRIHPQRAHQVPAARHTLSLLTLKPGLFTAHGRDACGTLWFDDLGVSATLHAAEPPSAWLNAAPHAAPRPHASHKGSFGDVAIVGGEGLAARGMGMTGAALLAASAALHGGAGRVLVSLLDEGDITHIPTQPELMLRRFDRLELDALTVVCGCGGGDAVASRLPAVLHAAPRLVLDADALNVIAADPALQTALRQRATAGQTTVLTPHPLEAARLLGATSAQVQQGRLRAATTLAQRFACTVVLKGSGSVIATPGQAPVINPTGNALLATAGTGDVLAGLIGAHLAAGRAAPNAASAAVYWHGWAADGWPAASRLTAGVLAVRAGAALAPPSTPTPSP